MSILINCRIKFGTFEAMPKNGRNDERYWVVSVLVEFNLKSTKYCK